MNRPELIPIPAFEDNYLWLLHGDGNEAVVVDPGDARPVLGTLDERSLALGAILVTHHHADHVGGILPLLERYPVPVYGPARESIPGITIPLGEGDQVSLCGMRLEVLEVPGHTAGHIAYRGEGLLFCGDTLFSGGCGRLFEGTPEQMHQSLQRLAALDPATLVCCAHEYTEANLRFALAVEPDNPALQQRYREVGQLRSEGLPSLPSTIAIELQTNPFLRTHVPAVRSAAENHAGRRLTDEVEVFAVLRAWKDRF